MLETATRHTSTFHNRASTNGHTGSIQASQGVSLPVVGEVSLLELGVGVVVVVALLLALGVIGGGGGSESQLPTFRLTPTQG